MPTDLCISSPINRTPEHDSLLEEPHQSDCFLGVYLPVRVVHDFLPVELLLQHCEEPLVGLWECTKSSQCRVQMSQPDAPFSASCSKTRCPSARGQARLAFLRVGGTLVRNTRNQPRGWHRVWVLLEESACPCVVVNARRFNQVRPTHQSSSATETFPDNPFSATFLCIMGSRGLWERRNGDQRQINERLWGQWSTRRPD